jgi:hypothetical protein
MITDCEVNRGQLWRLEKSDPMRLAYWVVLAFSLVLWIMISWVGAPRFGGTDVFIYKDAGCNLALGKGFYSIGLPGTDDLQPHLFASNGPAVPFLFGLFASFLGCNGYTNTFFELLFAALATLAVAALLEPAIQRRWKVICAVTMGLALPSGLVATEPDRPEIPSLAIFVFACLLARSQKKRLSHFAAPVVAGVCALFFPFGGIICGLAIWAIVNTAPELNGFALEQRTLIALKLIAGFLLPILVVIVFYRTADSSAWLRFVGNAFGTNSGVGSILHNEYSSLLYHAVFSSAFYSLSLVLSSLAVMAMVCYFTAKQLYHRCKLPDVILTLIMVICILSPVVLFPKQNNYMAWTRSALLVLLATSQARLAIEARRNQLTTLVLVTIGVAVLPFVGLDAIIRIQSKPDYEIAKSEIAKYVNAVHEAKINQLIAVPSRLYFLYKENLPQIGDAHYIAAEAKPSDIGGIIECNHNGTYRENQLPSELYLPPLVLFAEASIHYTPHILGYWLARHEWGWSCDQYLSMRRSVPQ